MPDPYPVPRTPLSLIFMGTPDFAVPCLRDLIASEHNVVAVYSQPPRPAGRGHKLQPSPVHRLAEEHGIPVFTPTRLKSEEIQRQFRDHKADAAIVAAYGLILPQPILDACPLGCINVHPSKLPRWRGAAPIQRTIMAGDSETAMTIMQMDEGLDTGDILFERPMAIPDGMTAGQLHDQMAEMAGSAILHTLNGLRDGSIVPRPQPQEGMTYAPKITRDEAKIDWTRPAAVVRQHILGLSPYPGAWFEYAGEKIKVLDAVTAIGNTASGTVLDSRLTIACADAAIRPILMQRPGKKPMTAEEMLRGYPVPSGTVLT